MLSKDIRSKFLDFFKNKDHEIVPSDALVPRADPTLLFTSAGMNQFKEQFLGHNVTYKRAASSQKCLRTADLANVGRTPSHHTFFEMLGNFSFGDYFKKEAVEWGWEFMTEALGLKKEKLWVSVYEEDEESYGIWRDVVKVPTRKIVKLGAKDNFWPSNAPKDGPNGPCGPCSEIFYDWGEKTGCRKKSCDPSCDCGRFVEVWNLVFTQFDRKDGGKLDPLPTKNIDTGMGLERITAVMQRVKTNFETDLFVPIIREIKRRTPKLKVALYNAIADHIRAVTFAICDGVAPSNEERGYVIRKLIRRAYLYGNTRGPFLFNVVPKVVEVMKDAYPELLEKREEISLVVKEEEERFEHTLSMAMPILEEGFATSKKKTLDGEKMFKLVDTYGLPLEVIESEAEKRKFKLDTDKFNELMKERKALSRAKSKLEGNIFGADIAFHEAPSATDSNKLPLSAKVVYMRKILSSDGIKSHVTSVEATAGEEVWLFTDPQSSRFYAEAGGQVGDQGAIKSQNGAILDVQNTVKKGDRIFHIAKVKKGLIKKGDTIELSLDSDRKKRIARNHTATHLLHSALRRVLGEHVHQAGSLVADDRLRFDFTHMKKLSDRELERIESMVNEYINKGIAVKKEEKALEAAKKEGAIALFGEKYAEDVTVISVEDYSKEVCGGTHVDNTKDIGIFKIMRESSVASGIRRIEAVTHDAAREWVEKKKEKEKKAEEAAKKKEEEKRLAKERMKEAEGNAELVIKKGKDVNGVKVIIEEVKDANMGVLRNLADRIKTLEKSSFIMLASKSDDKVNIVLALTKDLVSGGANASEEIKSIAKIVEGSGGGRPDFAQAGGKDPSKLSKVFEFAEKTATDIIGGQSK